MQPSSIARVCGEGFQTIPLMFGHLYFRVFDDYYKLSLVNQNKVYIHYMHMILCIYSAYIYIYDHGICAHSPVSTRQERRPKWHCSIPVIHAKIPPWG